MPPPIKFGIVSTQQLEGKERKSYKEIQLKNWGTHQAIEWLAEVAPEFKDYGHMFQVNGKLLVNIAKNPELLRLAMPQGSDTSKIEEKIKALVKNQGSDRNDENRKSESPQKEAPKRERRRRGRPRRQTVPKVPLNLNIPAKNPKVNKLQAPVQAQFQRTSSSVFHKNPTTPEVVSTLFPNLCPSSHYKPSPNQPIVTSVMHEEYPHEDGKRGKKAVNEKKDSKCGNEESFPPAPPLFNEFHSTLLDNIY